MRILFVRTYYPEFLKSFYAQHPAIEAEPYDPQLKALFDTGFGVGDSHSFELRRLGCQADEIICNADALQARWAIDHGLQLVENVHDRRRQIAAAQIAKLRPDVLFVFEWCPLGDGFLTEMKQYVRLLVGQVASPLHKDRTYAAYDLMLSSYPPLVDQFRSLGIKAAPLRLGFDERVLDRMGHVSKCYDVTFVGGLAPSHPNRIAWLETVSRKVPVHLFGYGWDALPDDSTLHARLHGEVWGWNMYRTLAASRVTLNRHARIDVDVPVKETFANNMRLYEATGVGTCLITEQKLNLVTLFEPDREVVTYATDAECADRVNQLLDNEVLRNSVAQAGQARTLSEHTYRHRISELLELLRTRL